MKGKLILTEASRPLKDFVRAGARLSFSKKYLYAIVKILLVFQNFIRLTEKASYGGRELTQYNV